MPKLPNEIPVQEQMKRITRRSFGGTAVGAISALGGWWWLRTRSNENDIPWPLRRVLGFNERLASAYFRPGRLAPTFPPEESREPRVNGTIGLDSEEIANWRLNLQTDAPGQAPMALTMKDVKTLPRVEMTTELKCIEGWSDPVSWAGVRFADFMTAFKFGTWSGKPTDVAGHPEDLLPYVGIETPDADYYVGLDMASALHPQTLLCYEMNGQPLTVQHGAPLRLVIPVKYGIKNIKRIGKIRFCAERPRDYWAARGYDWYAGH